MCYSILECLLGKLQSQLAALNDNMGQSCLKPNRRRHFKACPCWVSITFIYHSTYQSGVMVIRFLSQHTPLVDSKGQPPFSVQQGQYPTLEMGSQTYEMQIIPRTTVLLQKLRVRQDEYSCSKKGNKDSGCHGRIHLHSIPVRFSSRAPALPAPHWAVLSCNALGILPTARWAAEALFLCLLSSWSTFPIFALNRTNAYCYTDSSMEST